MRAGTKIVIAARNIGDSNHGGDTFEGTVDEGLRWIIRFIANTTMARRVDICIGRDFNEVWNQIAGTKINKQIAEDDIMSEMEQLMSLPRDDEDDYVGPTE